MKTPFLSTAFSENGKKVKKRFERILEMKNKRIGVVVIVGVAAVLLILSSVLAVNNSDVAIIGGADGPTSIYVSQSGEENRTLDEAVSAKLLESADSYSEGEVNAEGHIILEVDEDAKKAYVLTTYGEYGFVNGNMTKISGTGVIPAVAYFTEENNNFNVTSFEYPGDGAMFMEDIKKMFPENLQKRCAGSDYENDYAQMLLQEQEYVKRYLKSIDREAEITEHESGPLLTDLGVSVEVSNGILEMEKNVNNFYRYPYFVGSCEYIEDGVRVVYTMDYNKGDSEIVYKKTRYEDGKLLEELRISAETGEVVKAVSMPSEK